MNSKKIVTACLLAFVAVAVAAWAAREFRGRTGSGSGSPASGPTSASPTQAEDAASAVSDKVIAYYFHGNVRCTTCNTMEALAQEAIETAFGGQLASGGIEWRVVNYQEPENKHFRDDFDLVAASLVLVAVHDGKPTAWKLLTDTWLLVDDKAAFSDYVQNELRMFLENPAAAGKKVAES